MEIEVKTFDELSNRELYEILRLRSEVFVVEQECIYQDLDNADFEGYHLTVRENGQLKAYLRILPKGVVRDEVSLGRVISAERRKGYGSIAIQEGIKVAKEKYNPDKIIVIAQRYAEKFYEINGFKTCSGDIMEDGIVHVRMELGANA